MEAEHPVRIEDYAFVPDTCGAGKYRGGVGIRRSYRILADDALLQMRTDRVKFLPYGLAGGEPGGASRNAMIVDGHEQELPGKITMRVGAGTLIVHEQAGAGGFGPPLERDPDAILEDYLDGKITDTFAQLHYKVAFDGNEIDHEKTARLRSQARDGNSVSHSTIRG